MAFLPLSSRRAMGNHSPSSKFPMCKDGGEPGPQRLSLGWVWFFPLHSFPSTARPVPKPGSLQPLLLGLCLWALLAWPQALLTQGAAPQSKMHRSKLARESDGCQYLSV